MYPTVLIAHSWIRWAVIILGLWTVVAAARLHPAANRASLLFTISLDVQLLLGIALYAVLSPITLAAMTDMASAMRIPAMRFWAVEHATLMILALVFAHVGRVVARVKARSGMGGSRAPLFWYATALLALLAAIPWPFLSYGRALIRL
jgi:hypothetical protein